MTCHNCSSICKKFGKFGPRRIQRWRCKQCKKTFSEDQDRPLDTMRIPMAKAVMALHLLLEGNAVASVERVTGHKVPTHIAPRRAGDPAELVADPSRAEQMLNWKAKRSLEEIIATAWKWANKS